MTDEKFISKLVEQSILKERKGDFFIYEQDNIDIFEKVELKGEGHPDTLSDALASHLSRVYSNYTINKYGAILHHNFDKVGMMGGVAKVSFGRGEILSPIRVLLNGRASDVFGKEVIPLKEFLIEQTKEFFREKLPILDVEKDLRIMYEVSSGSSPGQVGEDISDNKRAHWFKPRDIEDIGYLKKLVSNDTSTGVSYYPLSKTDEIVKLIEQKLNSKTYKKDKPWLGSDIKITATRHNKLLSITACIPQIAKYVMSLQEYKNNLEIVREEIKKTVLLEDNSLTLTLELNTRDKFDSVELYLTVTGSSIEMGDEGFVGRGNRGNGIINMTKGYSMEGACGKNPVYHVGFIYTECAHRIAKKIYEQTNLASQVFITSQSGRSLSDPKDVTLIIEKNKKYEPDVLRKIVFEELNQIPLITKDFLQGAVNLY